MTLDLATAVPISGILSNVTSMIASLSPVTELLIGVLFAFFIIGFTLSHLNGATPEQMEMYNKAKQQEDEEY